MGKELKTQTFSLRGSGGLNPLSRHPSCKDLYLSKKHPPTFSFENQWGSHPRAPQDCEDLRSSSSRARSDSATPGPRTETLVERRWDFVWESPHLRIPELRPEGQASCRTHLWEDYGDAVLGGSLAGALFRSPVMGPLPVGGGGSSAIFFVFLCLF